jgi:hypothetical protein
MLVLCVAGSADTASVLLHGARRCRKEKERVIRSMAFVGLSNKCLNASETNHPSHGGNLPRVTLFSDRCVGDTPPLGHSRLQRRCLAWNIACKAKFS